MPCSIGNSESLTTPYMQDVFYICFRSANHLKQIWRYAFRAYLERGFRFKVPTTSIHPSSDSIPHHSSLRDAVSARSCMAEDHLLRGGYILVHCVAMCMHVRRMQLRHGVSCLDTRPTHGSSTRRTQNPIERGGSHVSLIGMQQGRPSARSDTFDWLMGPEYTGSCAVISCQGCGSPGGASPPFAKYRPSGRLLP